MDLNIIIVIVSILWVGSEISLAIIKRSLSGDKGFDKSSLRVLWLTISVTVSLGIILGFQSIGYFGNGSKIFSITGLLFIACGLLVRWTAIYRLKHHFTVDVSIAKDHRIIRNGIYRYVRHPAYAGSLLSFFGLGLYFANYISMLIIFVPVCIAFLYRIHVEEKVLSDNFGEEYTKYCASTKRLIPGIY
jgi:protein-S-isoprenylcysteine O-methyltransferase Ste14